MQNDMFKKKGRGVERKTKGNDDDDFERYKSLKQYVLGVWM